jgi:hypothetical protein
MFENFKIEDAADRLAAMETAFSASGKPGTFLANALRVIGERMLSYPERHVEFGPYWWAVKEALAGAGYEFGSSGMPAVAAAYRGESVAETLVMAEAFKDMYRGTYIVGTSGFDLEGDGVLQDMADSDMLGRTAV